MITKLPKDLEARFPEIRDEWIKIGLSCEPLDFEEAKLAVSDAYKVAGLEPPKLWFKARSPMECALMATILNLKDKAQVSSQVKAQVSDQVMAQVIDKVMDQVGSQVSFQVSSQVGSQVSFQVSSQVSDQVIAQVSDQVWAQVRDQVRAQVSSQVWAQMSSQVSSQVRDQVRAQVSDQVWAQVRDQVSVQVWAQVRAQVRDQVRDQVSNQVSNQVRDQVSNQVRDQVRDQVRVEDIEKHVSGQVFGSHDAVLLSFYAVMIQFLSGVTKIEPLIRVTKHCGWWLPFNGACILQDRHCELHRDDQGRLHNTEGKAVLYRDGFGVYAVHGVRVDERVIKREFTAQDIKSEENAEVRRVMLDLYGAENFIQDCGLESLSKDDFGELFVAELPDDENLVMVKVVNSTPEPDGTFKDYWLRVPPDMKTAKQAVSWTFGEEENEFELVAQT